MPADHSGTVSRPLMTGDQRAKTSDQSTAQTADSRISISIRVKRLPRQGPSTQIRVPIDDTHTRHFWYACYKPAPGRDAPVQDEVPVYNVIWQDDNGEFIVDFVDGGDIMACVTQGAIADRTRETLGASDGQKVGGVSPSACPSDSPSGRRTGLRTGSRTAKSCCVQSLAPAARGHRQHSAALSMES